uniref:Uncharacterized protein n=1 Tax=Helianthus annuus TaxID=4232 RepID=A0A251VA66_HELAN
MYLIKRFRRLYALALHTLSLCLCMFTVLLSQVSLQDKNDACRKFFSRLKGSLAFWEGRLPIDASFSNYHHQVSLI